MKQKLTITSRAKVEYSPDIGDIIRLPNNTIGIVTDHVNSRYLQALILGTNKRVKVKNESIEPHIGSVTINQS